MSDAPSSPSDDTSEQAGLTTVPYEALPGLEDVLLEDSFVREIVEDAPVLRFVLMAALDEGHPFYEPHPPSRRRCFIPATLSFSQAQWRWIEHGTWRFTDSTGAVDLGNIDRFVAPPDGGYRIEGDFGVIEVIRSRAPIFTVVGASPGLRTYRREAFDEWVRDDSPPTGAPKASALGHEHAQDNGDAPHAHKPDKG